MKTLLRRTIYYLFHGIMTVLLMASPVIALEAYDSPGPTILQSSALHEYWNSMLSPVEEKAQVALEADNARSDLTAYIGNIEDMIDETILEK